MASNSFGEFDTPTNFRGRFEWSLEDDSEERRPEPKVGSFRRQMRRHRSSRCCKILMMLALSMTLTQVFFYYTGTSVATFNYKRTMPMAMVFESLGYDYNPEGEFQEQDIDDDYDLLQEEDALYDEVIDVDSQYADALQLAQSPLEHRSAIQPEDQEQYDGLSVDDKNNVAVAEPDHGLLPDKKNEPVLFVPKERPLPSGPAAPANALPTQPKEKELLGLVFEGGAKSPVSDSEESDPDGFAAPNYPALANFGQINVPQAQFPQIPAAKFPGMPDIHDQSKSGFASLGQVQNQGGMVGDIHMPITNEEANEKIDGILRSFQDKDHPVKSLNDEQLLRLLTRPPGTEGAQSAESHLLSVLEKFESDLKEKHNTPQTNNAETAPNTDQQINDLPTDQKPTLIDREPDIPWHTEDTNTGESNDSNEPAQSAYAIAFASLVKNQNNPSEQTRILKELMQLQAQMQEQDQGSSVIQAQGHVELEAQPAPSSQIINQQPVIAPEPQPQNQAVLAQQATHPVLQGAQVPVQQPTNDYTASDEAKILHEDYIAEDMFEVAEQEHADARTAAALSVGSEFLYGYFPDGFMWSVATAAFQIEGGWNEGGKGKSIWDVFTHEGNVEDGSNAHVSCDSYHRYIEDVQMLKQLGVKQYRFSISWSRIQPTGIDLVPNRYGVLYYNKLIDALLEVGIQPVATLYHWDLPQALQENGGWLNQTLIVKAFHNYAKICFTEFGDRVKFWITMNEPSMMAWAGYGRGKKAPGIHGESELVYIAGHNIIAAHSTVYRMYQRDFQRKQRGFVGISLNIVWKEPKTSKPEDVAATHRAMMFDLGWFAEPIYGSGDYPDVMKAQVARKSRENGLPRSRLPEFTAEEKQRNKGTSDFFGLNTYTTRLVEHFPQSNKKPTYFKDQDVKYSVDPSWEMGPRGRAIYPEGIRKLVNWIQTSYGQRPIYITENGISDETGAMNDTIRVNYLKGYINNILKAITIDGIRVVGYTVWTLMDNFEWERGYQEKLGLYHVDFHDPDRRRTPRESARFYAKLIADNGFPPPPS